MIGLPWSTRERLILWMAIGVALYFGYGYRKSRLRGARDFRVKAEATRSITK
jgi:APA family basic amino acid/polyamine antiporter